MVPMMLPNIKNHLCETSLWRCLTSFIQDHVSFVGGSTIAWFTNEYKERTAAGPTVAELQQRLQAANQENQRMREENRRLYDFKRCVTDVFEGLHVRAPSGLSLSTDTVEEYVYELRSMLLRIGSLQENDMRRITDYVEDMVGRTTH